MARCNGKVRSGGMAAFAIGLSLFMSYPVMSYPVETAKKFSEWSAPVNLGPDINSAFEEFLPEVSKNGLSLYFASNRPGPFGAAFGGI